MGISEPRIDTPMMPIGISRSVSGRLPCPPTLRARLALSAVVTPLMIGPMIRSRVQMAATPMVPAPMKRTFSRKVVPTKVSRSAALPRPASPVCQGTSTNQLMTRPTSMAMPTAMPTRCPTPIRAIDRLVVTVVAPAPNPKLRDASVAASLVWARIA